jgi:hypothetical protein
VAASFKRRYDRRCWADSGSRRRNSKILPVTGENNVWHP